MKSVTATGAEALASLVRTFGRVVEGLHIGKKFLHLEGPAGVASLGEALRAWSFPQLRALNISNNNAGAAGVTALGEALRAGSCPAAGRAGH
jgi:hypothetical protein